ncbi:hypothetical protein M0D69_04700 [Caballeronia sp. SEWSISQ10-4 2]|uniref:hypothetical protein n=1 Tax=Caballeronia sp. SEWSISQ10-4 2 TaxID=2937438 RepID=UPI0026518A10|nr:hypothetical protein [Caballeronia sp. SEWSISQ10-4 2]MDN7177323.1 hypothetical protein [Caballeronia sp. SEWSISQ10-4 2]
MNSLYEQSAELIDLVEKSGMRGELEARVEAQNLAEWRQQIATLHAQRKERDQVMPAIDAAAVEAREAYALAEQKALDARLLMNYAMGRAYATRCGFGEGQVTSLIEKHAPKFMHDAYDDLQEPIDFLRGTVRVYSTRQRVAWGFHSIDVSMSNADEVFAIRHRCEAGQSEIRRMMLDDVTPLDEHRARCAAIVHDCLVLTQPHLKDDREWLRHEQKKQSAKQKSA